MLKFLFILFLSTNIYAQSNDSLLLSGWIIKLNLDKTRTVKEDGKIIFEIRLNQKGSITSIKPLANTASGASADFYCKEIWNNWKAVPQPGFVPPKETVLKYTIFLKKPTIDNSPKSGKQIVTGAIRKKVAAPAVKEKPEVTVTQKPIFKGDYISFIQSNCKFPQQAMDNNISGRVIVEYILEKDGTISEVKILKGIAYGCDEEAIRVVFLMSGKWIPGTNNGLPVRFKTFLPIYFKQPPKNILMQYYDNFKNFISETF